MLALAFNLLMTSVLRINPVMLMLDILKHHWNTQRLALVHNNYSKLVVDEAGLLRYREN